MSEFLVFCSTSVIYFTDDSVILQNRVQHGSLNFGNGNTAGVALCSAWWLQNFRFRPDHYTTEPLWWLGGVVVILVRTLTCDLCVAGSNPSHDTAWLFLR